jgi:glycosyltransferase involved in cell wall biosynthesis
LKLLFVGNCVATRASPLVFEALKRTASLPCTLTVVGSGAALKDWQASSRQLGLAARVQFTGSVPRTQLRSFYTEADAFVFPALRDSGGSGLLEAMSFGLPVLCCDWGGPAEMVDEKWGVKFPVDSPERLISAMRAAFERLHAEPGWRLKLGEGAFERARNEFSWTKKRQVLEAAYASLLARRR